MRELLMIHALDERDLLRSRIMGKIGKITFLDYKKQCEERTAETLMEEKAFCDKVKDEFQSIKDLIRNYDELDAAIIASNATTIVKTKYGNYTVAAAIALKQRLKLSNGRDINKAALLLDKNLDLKKDFESEMIGVMQKQMIDIMAKLKNAQTALEASAEGMRNSILGGDSYNYADDKAKKDSASIAVVDEYLKKNSYKLVDPLSLADKLQSLKEEREDLYKELDTAVKISNATTMIQVNF